MKYICLLFLFVISAVNSYGQKVIVKEAYRVDKELAKKTADKISNEYVPDDKVNQANYQVALNEAFNVYLRCSQVKFFWRSDTIKLLTQEIEMLRQSRANCEEKSKILSDSLTKRSSTLDSLKKDVEEQLERLSAMRADSLTSATKFDKEVSNLLARERAQESKLDSLKKEYAEVCALAEKLGDTNKRLKSDTIRINFASKNISDKKKLHSSLRQRLDSASASCRSMSLLDIDKKTLLALIKEYDALKAQIEVISPDWSSEIYDNAMLLDKYVQLSDVLNAAVEQMGEKYVEVSNLQYARKIAKLREEIQGNLSEEQLLLLDGIYSDLVNEKNAYSHFCDMLRNLQEEYICIVDDTERQRIEKDGFFKKEIDALGVKRNPPYSSSYKLLNKAFERLQKDLTIGSKTLPNERVNTEEKFRNYLNTIKSNL